MKEECKAKDDQWEFYYMDFPVTCSSHFLFYIKSIKKVLFFFLTVRIHQVLMRNLYEKGVLGSRREQNNLNSQDQLLFLHFEKTDFHCYTSKTARMYDADKLGSDY